jgi:hypothetical protein
VHLQHDPPRYRVPQRDTNDPATKVRVIGKLTKVRLRRYIGPGFVVSLTAFFHACPREKMISDWSMMDL